MHSGGASRGVLLAYEPKNLFQKKTESSNKKNCNLVLTRNSESVNGVFTSFSDRKALLFVNSSC